MRTMIPMLVSAAVLAGCVHTVIQTGPEGGKHGRAGRRAAAAAPGERPAIPAFPLAALNGPHARSVKLYVEDDGTFSKYAVYVTRDAVPDWVHAMADKEIGQGEDVEYEVEQYADGAMVFEVTRKVGEQTLELSVDSVTRARRYIERKHLPLAQVPAHVRKAAEGVTGETAAMVLERSRLFPKERPHDRAVFESFMTCVRREPACSEYLYRP